MKLPTTKLVLVKRDAAETEGYIKIKVMVPGDAQKPKFKPTGYKVPENMWDKDNGVVLRQYTKADKINRDITRELNRIITFFEDAQRRDIPFTAALIESALANEPAAGNFLQFYWQHIQYIRPKCSEAYITHFEIEYKKLMKFSSTINFHDITPTFLERYETTLANYAQTTINTKAKRLKEIVDKAVEQGLIDRKAIAGYKWPNYSQPEKPYLTLKETELITGKIYSGAFNDYGTMRVIACFFMVECYSGVRFSDWGRWAVETLVNRRCIKVTAQKNGAAIYIPIDKSPRLAKIVDYITANKLVFNLSERTTNGALKAIAMVCGIKKHITTHVGRHTCGTLLGEIGGSTSEIAQVLGIHESTAKTYVKHTQQGVDNMYDRTGGL